MMLKSFALFAQVALALAAPVTPRADGELHFEAENATLSGNTKVLTEQTGFTGTGYVGGFEAAEDKITFTITSEEQALYDVTLRYAGIYGDKHTTLVLNSGVSEDVTLAATEEFVDLQAAQVLLEAGENTIDIVSNWGWYLIDSITLTPTPARGPHSIGDSLVNANADSNAKALYAYLKSKYGKNILSGQQGNTWVTWVTENVGKTPAVIGLDFMDYSPSRVERGTTGTDTDNALAFDKKGGIVTFAWHWNAPTGLYDTDENPWWSGFYTRATDFNIATALADTTNANYTLLIRDIDAIAEQLKILQDANVPVLFRPLHEAEGAWFWWGAQGPEPAIKLYRILYDRLTNHHSINNLVWVWNSVAADWYPGDDVVDIVSADSYTEGNGPLSSLYNQLVDLGNDTKIVAATEVGSAPLPNLLELYEAHWSWFVVWEEPYINDPEWNSLENLKTIYNDEYTLTLDEIQGWKESS